LSSFSASSAFGCSAFGSSRPCQNPDLSGFENKMDAERINLIGTQLADLSRRTQALRGYL